MLNLTDLYHQQNKVKLSNKYYAIAEENKEYEDQYEDQDESHHINDISNLTQIINSLLDCWMCSSSDKTVHIIDRFVLKIS